ncbi:MAG: hypothetical protein WCT08_02070 [Patescibacteria group bacterium]|jgi:hypothetical protein
MLVIFSVSALAETVIISKEISGFAPGKGMSQVELAKKNQAVFQMLTDSVCAFQHRYIKIYSYVDGLKFDTPTKEDVLEAALKVSRYEWAALHLKECGTPRDLIWPRMPDPDNEKKIGGDHRKVVIEVVQFDRYVTPAEMQHSIDSAFAAQPKLAPVVNNYKTEVINHFDNRIWFGIGVAYTPAERFMPIACLQWGNDRFRIALEGGYSFYREDRTYCKEEMSYIYRYGSVHVLVRPWLEKPFELIFGGQRSEINRYFDGPWGEKRTGPELGAQVTFAKSWVLAAVWTPVYVYQRGTEEVEWENSHVRVIIAYQFTISGGKH